MSEKKQSNSKVVGALVGIACLALLALATFFLIRQKAANDYKDRFAAVVADPRQDVELNKQRIAVAKEVREKMKPWALAHKDLLKKMMAANANNSAIALEVFTKVPAETRGPKAVVTIEDRKKGPTNFTWQALENDYVRPNATPSQVGTFRKQEIASDFARQHDVLLSSSMNPGLSHIDVWASGRITETTIPINPRVSGQPVYGDPVSKEIIPPYDFLG